MEKINKFFESKIMVIISSIFFFLSLALMLIKEFTSITISPYLDPGIITIIISGYPIFFEAISSLSKEKKITSELLVSIAIISSFVIGEVFASCEVAYIMTIGEMLEEKTIGKARKGLSDIISFESKNAFIICDGSIKEIKIENIKIGDILRVLPGEEIPIDGKVLKGSSYINQSILTGESLPVYVELNSNVFAGTINTSGYLEIEATKLYKDTSLNKMVKLLKDAEKNEAPIQRIADKWASILVPVSLLIALITGIVTFIIYGNEDNFALIKAITIVVVFCPCALSLSTPTAVVASIGKATKYGIIIKSGEALEKMGSTDIICFDKTGTITEGKLEVSDVIEIDSKKDEILKICNTLESMSNHPIAKAITEYINKLNVGIYNAIDFKMIDGVGISANINNKVYYAVNEKIIDENKRLDIKGKLLIYIKSENEILGVITLKDKIRDSSKNVIAELKRENIRTVLLTGDNLDNTKGIVEEVGIDEYHSSLLPENKVEIIKDYINKGYNVAMVGDGINDSPSMKTATNGISLKNIGADITKEAASIILLNDDISLIPFVTKLSKVCVKTIKFNITVSLVINFIAIILSILGVLNPTLGAIVHNVGSVLVIMNAALIYNRKIK